MQHSAVSTPPPPTTRERILDATYRVSAQRGLAGATTREIAEVAEVNEVTLFRHFGSKEKLLAALFQRSISTQAEALTDDEPESNDLLPDLLRYARRFEAMLFSHETLIRTLIGEARRHPAESRQVISEAAKPMRERLIRYLERAQETGSVRRDLHLAPAIDAFTGMLLSGMLKRTNMPDCLGYTQDDYLATCVDLFVRGIAEPAKAPRKAAPRRA